MKTLSTTLVLAGAVALSPSALSQSPYFDPVVQREIPSPSASGNGSGRTRAASGDFTGDHRRDVVMIDRDDDNLDVYYDAGLMDAAFPIAQGAKDVSWVRATTTGHERFVTTGAFGLALHDQYDGGTYASKSIPAGSIWDGAERVIACTFDQNDTTDVVGLSDDRQTVIVTTEALGGAPLTTTFAVGAPVLDIAVANWSDDAGNEILLLFPTGLDVRKRNGGQVGAVQVSVAPNQDCGLTVFQQTGFGHDRVAIVYEDGGAQYVKVCDATHDEAPVAVAGAYALAAADVDGDDDDEIFVACYDVDQCELLDNQSNGVAPGTSATFTAGAGETVDLYDGSTVANTADQKAWPLFEDFDNDGDPDVALYVADLDALVVRYNDRVNAMGGAPMLVGQGQGEELSKVWMDFDVPQGSEPTVDMTLRFVASPLGADAMMLQVWKQDQATGLVDPQVFRTEYRAIDEAVEDFFIDLDLGTSFADALDHNYYAVVQEVVENADGIVVDVGPVSVTAVSMILDEVAGFAQATGGQVEPILVCVIPPGGTTEPCSSEPIDIQFITDESTGEIPDPPIPEEREIGPGGVCVPDVPPVPLPPKPVE